MFQTLKLRVLTAAVLGPLFILGVLFLPTPYFALLTGAVILPAAWEWTRLSGYHAKAAWAAVAAAALLMSIAYALRGPLAAPLLGLAAAGWLLVAGLLHRRRRHGPLIWPRAGRLASGVGVLVPAWLALVALQEARPGAACLLLVLIWAADTGAYFGGRRWGRRKLAPAISPGKSVEGVWGGLVAAGAVAAVVGILWGFDPRLTVLLVAWSAVTAGLSVYGDLFESNWKRLADLKDSGTLLPGHGGVLDRIDSLTAAAPLFAVGWLWWFDAASA